MELLLHNLARLGKPFAGPGDEFFFPPRPQFQRWKGLRLEGNPVLPVLGQPHGNFMAAKINQLLRPEFVPKRLLHHGGVRMPDVETNQGADISKHGLLDGRGKLVNELVGENKTEPVFPGLGENGHKSFGGKVLELVNKKEKVLAFLLRLACPRHRRELELRDQKRSEQIGLVVAKLALGEIGDEQPPGVNRKGDVHLAFHLAQNVADDGIQQELAELVLDGGDGFALKAGFIAGIFILPKGADERVFDLLDDPGAIFLVGEHSIDAQEGRVLAVEKGGHGIVQNVFQSRPPRVMPDALAGADDAGGDQMPFIPWGTGEQIQSHREFEVCRIEIHQMIGPPRRNVVQQFFGQVAVRVNEADAVTECYMLNEQIAEQCRLAGPGFANDVDMVAVVGRRNAKRPALAPSLTLSDHNVWFVVHGSKTSRHSCTTGFPGPANAVGSEPSR